MRFKWRGCAGLGPMASLGHNKKRSAGAKWLKSFPELLRWPMPSRAPVSHCAVALSEVWDSLDYFIVSRIREQLVKRRHHVENGFGGFIQAQPKIIDMFAADVQHVHLRKVRNEHLLHVISKVTDMNLGKFAKFDFALASLEP